MEQCSQQWMCNSLALDGVWLPHCLPEPTNLHIDSLRQACQCLCFTDGTGYQTLVLQHGEERAQAAEAGQVHDVLQLEGVFQGLDDQAIGGEIRLHDCGCIPLDLRQAINDTLVFF